MGDYGIKISIDGQDVETALDKNLVYSSKYNGMKIAKHDVAATPQTVSHGLAYVPMFINYRRYDGTKFRMDSSAPDNLAPPHATSSSIIFPNGNNYYFIFIDKVSYGRLRNKNQ